MLIAMTAFAVVAAFSQFIGLAPIISFAGIIGALFVAPVTLATLAVYSRGRRRTFFCGAFAGSLAAHYLIVTFSMAGSLGMLMMLGIVQLAAVGSCGVAAVLARRFAERRGWHLPSDERVG